MMPTIDLEKLENPARRRLFSRKRTPAKHLRLPWVKSEALFIDKCTQCHQCISACDTQIITRDADGFPRIDFSDGECTFCNKCIDTCEQPLFVTEEQRTNTLAEAIKTKKIQPWPGQLAIKTTTQNHQCLAANNIFCQSCSDECEVEAINFSYQKVDENGNVSMSVIPQPTLNIADCTQCGACISNCPQDSINLNVSDFAYQR